MIDDDISQMSYVSRRSGADESPQPALHPSLSSASLTRRFASEDTQDLDFSVDKLVEYEWPAGSGEKHMLQEHVSQFLDHKFFHRRFPELDRRPISSKEKEYLREKGLVSPMMCELGLVALKQSQVYELLTKHFPIHFQQYCHMLNEREKMAIAKQHEENKTLLKSDKMAQYMRKAMRDVSEFNIQLNRTRREDRRCMFDLQTSMVHIPRASPTPKPYLNKSKYPVALLPNQYQDYYQRYTKEQLAKLPFSTLLSHPYALQEAQPADRPLHGNRSINMDLPRPGLHNPRPQPSVALKEVETSDTSSELASESSEDEDDDLSDEEYGKRRRSGRKRRITKLETPVAKKKASNASVVVTPAPAPVPRSALCSICSKGMGSSRRGVPENLLLCSSCGSSAHPSCLMLRLTILPSLQSYPWQCMECKTCTTCLQAHDEENMLFCDNCDRGYHSYCVGLKEIPLGRWVCSRCGSCACCLSRVPGPRGTQWAAKYSKPIKGEMPKLLQTLCIKCSDLFDNGSFCPVCLDVYMTPPSRTEAIICSSCKKFVHLDCEDVDDRTRRQQQQQLATNPPDYVCSVCTGAKENRSTSGGAE